MWLLLERFIYQKIYQKTGMTINYICRVDIKLLHGGDDEYDESTSATIVDRSRIVLDDLVFTLKSDQEKYFRPVVEVRDDRLVVVANNVFFDATRQAGILEVYCDMRILPEDLARFGLRQAQFDEESSPRYHNLVFFYMQQPFDLHHLEAVFGRFDDRVSGGTCGEKQTEVVAHSLQGCIEYFAVKRRFGWDEKRRLFSEIPLLHAALADKYGRIRSVDGEKLFQ